MPARPEPPQNATGLRFDGPQVAVGLLCNFFRRLNNIHPLIALTIPLAFIGGIVAALGGAIGYLLT